MFRSGKVQPAIGVEVARRNRKVPGAAKCACRLSRKSTVWRIRLQLILANMVAEVAFQLLIWIATVCRWKGLGTVLLQPQIEFEDGIFGVPDTFWLLIPEIRHTGSSVVALRPSHTRLTFCRQAWSARFCRAQSAPRTPQTLRNAIPSLPVSITLTPALRYRHRWINRFLAGAASLISPTEPAE